MTEITQFDKHTATEIISGLRADLHELAKKYGVLDITLSAGTYTVGEITAKISIKKFSSSVVDISDEGKVDWENYCTKHGLPEDGFGKQIIIAGEKYRICGLKKMKQKSPVLIENSKGKYKISAELAIKQLAKQS
jgi:hypothetical protein